MTTNQYVSVREAAQVLGVSERKVMDLIEVNKLQAYKIANQFLRLKKSEVMGLHSSGSIANETTQYFYTLTEKIKDFFYYNDFYLISGIIVLSLIYIILYF